MDSYFEILLYVGPHPFLFISGLGEACVAVGTRQALEGWTRARILGPERRTDSGVQLFSLGLSMFQFLCRTFTEPLLCTSGA